jgi:hypothetical protein
MAENPTADYEAAGRALADRLNMPYQPLTHDAQAREACALVSETCARHWHACPVRYDSDGGLLTLAVSNLAQAETIERIHRFFMSPFDVAFTMATGAEIDAAVERLFSAEPAQEPAQSEAAGGVHGSLADMSFSDLMQLLSAGAKSTRVELKSGEREGRVFLRDGQTIHAEGEGLTGEQAFYQFLRWQEGSFSAVECSDFPERTINGSTVGLLMEGARLADEDVDLGERS